MVNKKTITLERGDIVWVDLNPTKGHEQSGIRPAVVISPAKYNSFTGLVLICPITSKYKGYFFEVLVKISKKESIALVDQFRTVDIKERIKRKTGQLTQNEIDEILAKASVLLQ